jgi:hypothetical protein
MAVVGARCICRGAGWDAVTGGGTMAGWGAVVVVAWRALAGGAPLGLGSGDSERVF